MQEKICQSCGMPMPAEADLYGSDGDGRKTDEYCKYCYVKGAFTFQGTLEEMVEICLPHVLSANDDMDEAAGRTMLAAWLPTLKRWQAEERL